VSLVAEPGLRRLLRVPLRLDVPLLSGLLLLAVLGGVILYSASAQDWDVVGRQGLRLGLALVVMVAVAQIPPAVMFRWAPWLYVGGVLLLVAVELFGDVGKGAQRWLDLQFVRFQPSEMVKVTVPLMLARYLSEGSLPPSFLRVLGAAVLIAVPFGLIAQQPDLGTALLVGAAGAFVLFLAGLRWRLIGLLFALFAAAAPVAWLFLRDYQRQRVLTFLDPENDPLGAGYHIIQSKIAIGSGGLYGKGWLNGTQSHLDFLPERATDFIFAVVSEEFGLIGVSVLLTVYLYVIARGLYLASGAQDPFGRLLGGALILTFFVYVFVNVGMVSGLLPVVGVPLPLVSYGGTSLVTVMAGFGMLMSVYAHRRPVPR
jgi:rod shape determining protein RodA